MARDEVQGYVIRSKQGKYVKDVLFGVWKDLWPKLCGLHESVTAVCVPSLYMHVCLSVHACVTADIHSAQLQHFLQQYEHPALSR